MSSLIQEKCKLFVLSNDLLKRVMYQLNLEIEKSLSTEEHSTSNTTVKCYSTHIQDLPNGNEQGRFLALVVQNSFVQVVMVNFDENSLSKTYKVYKLDDKLILGPCATLFDFFAECLEKFLHSHFVQHEEFCLGFSFNLRFHDGRRHGKATLTEDTSCFSSAYDKNLLICVLQQAIDRRPNLQINVVALVSDVTGCLLASAYSNRDCRINVMVGMGLKASYVEKSVKVGSFDNHSGKPHVVDVEWGALGDHGALDNMQTEVDHMLDQTSVNSKQCTYEKMVSDLYMGEIMRLMMIRLTEEGVLFNGKGSRQLSTRGIFTSSHIGAIGNAKEGDLSVCRKILIIELGLPHVTTEDCINVKYISLVVWTRSAHLLSAGVACLINRIDSDDIVIGVDGDLLFKLPHYKKVMEEKISELVSPTKLVSVAASCNAAGIGAALAAAAIKEKRYLEERVKAKRKLRATERKTETAERTVKFENPIDKDLKQLLFG